MSQLKKGAILSYVSILLTNVIGLVLTPFIIRSLGDSEYGLYTLIGAIVGYISVMDLGLNNTIVRYVSKYRAENNSLKEYNFLGTVLLIYFVISLIVALVGFLLYYNLESFFGLSLTLIEMEKAKIMFLILIFNLAISLPGGSFTAIANAYEHFVFPRSLNIIKYIVRSVLVYVILTYGAESVGLVVLDTIVNIIVIVISFWYVKVRLKTKFMFSGVETSLMKQIFSYSLWIFLFALIAQFQWKGGQIIIGMKMSTSDVAIYAVGIMLGTYYGAFSGAIGGVFLPKATKMVVNKSSEDDLTKMFSRISRFSLMSLMIIFIGFFFIGKEFLLLWVGETYLLAWHVALVVMVAYTVPLIQTFANSLLEAKGLFKVKALVYLSCLTLGSLLAYILIDYFGVIAVIYCICAGWIVGQIIMNVYFHRVLKLNIIYFFKENTKGFLLTFILTSGIGVFLNNYAADSWSELSLKAMTLVGAYIVIIYFLGINKEEKKTINALFLKLKK